MNSNEYNIQNEELRYEKKWVYNKNHFHQIISKLCRSNLKFKGSELISVLNIEKGILPRDKLNLEIKYLSGDIKKIKTLCRIDTKNELEYYKNGGILQYVLRNMI